MEIIHSSNYTHSARTRTFSEQHNSIPPLLALWDFH